MDETTIRIPADYSPPGFELTRFYRSGGMAELWMARQLNPEREVIIKFLLPQYNDNPQYFERFAREAGVQGKLGHPNIVPVYGAGEVRQRRYIAMEYLPGGSLGDLLKQGPLTPARAIEITIDIARALGAAHRSGFVHRDVKPDNILFRSDGRTAVLSDFGIAGVMRDQSLLTQMLVQIGTPAYMSPEQAHNQDVREPSDIYSLGVVFYEMLTGSKPPPLQGENKPPQLPRHLQALQKVINRMMAFRSADRFGNADQLIDVLIQARIGLPQYGKAPGKNTAVVAALAMIVALGGAYAVMYFTQQAATARAAQQRRQMTQQLTEARLQLQQLPAVRAALTDALQQATAAATALRKQTATPDGRVAMFDAEREAATQKTLVELFDDEIYGAQGAKHLDGLLISADDGLRNDHLALATSALQAAVKRLDELKSFPSVQQRASLAAQTQVAQQLAGKWTLDTCATAIAWVVDKLQATAVWPDVASFELHLRPVSSGQIDAIITAPLQYRGLEFEYQLKGDKLTSRDKQTHNSEIFTRCP